MLTDKYRIIKQQDESDCGVACLLSVIKYYGGSSTVENLRKISGTNITGSTLLGLYQAATQSGFTAEGCEADMAALIKHRSPIILHVIINKQLQHYVVCFGITGEYNEAKFIIGDPAKGIIYLSRNELNEIWQSKTCLTLEPNKQFKKAEDIAHQKKLWIKHLLKEDIPLLSIAAVVGIAIAVLGVVMSLFSQHLIDDILPKRNFAKLNIGIVLVFLLLLSKEGLSALRQYFLFKQSKDFNIRIISSFYSKLLQLPKPFFDTRKIGELTARLTDTSRIQRVISQLAGNVVIDILVTLVVLVFLFSYSWKIAIASFLVLPIYFLLIYKHNKDIIDGQRNIMSSYAMSEANYISTLQGIEPIKNYRKQELFIDTNNSIYSKFQESILSLGKVQIRLGFVANIFGIIFLLSILLYCSYQVFNGNLKIGELMAIVGICSTLLPSIANLALISIPINEAKIAFDRMFEFTGIELEENNSPIEITEFDSLKVDGILFRFPGRRPLFNNVSLKIHKNEIVAIMGENGSGKSTISQIIQKHYDYENGNIIINQRHSLKDISVTSWRKIVSVIPQQIHIFNATVLENIAFDDAITKPKEVLNFLNDYGFRALMDSLPQSVMTLVGEEGINLSGGQKQIIAWARALYHQPQLLILDEATSAMDKNSEQFVLDLIERLKRKMAIIFITHRLHVLKNICDRVYLLEDGVIV
ncbi:peptidase domain-containing ABC transporter [Asinibacterium sp. OR53]|uniref:peptidase domain-containing ABC transporter n=1 Tax=Asinibacterium sp. OR53 TaxID=925409 RepID=UPI0004B711BF|nr:peptidase domain-containing ABC transporter [Asinibacterium sp. OR53]